MWRYGTTGKRQGEEDAEAEDDLQFVAVAAVEQEISEDTIPSATWESRTGGQFRLNADPSESLLLLSCFYRFQSEWGEDHGIMAFHSNQWPTERVASWKSRHCGCGFLLRTGDRLHIVVSRPSVSVSPIDWPNCMHISKQNACKWKLLEVGGEGLISILQIILYNKSIDRAPLLCPNETTTATAFCVHRAIAKPQSSHHHFHGQRSRVLIYNTARQTTAAEHSIITTFQYLQTNI